MAVKKIKCHDGIKGMDFINSLFEEEMIRKLNQEYGEFLFALNGQKNNSMSDELGELLKEYELRGLKYSTAPVITGKGSYMRFVFRKKLIILFPHGADREIVLCKQKREIIKLKDACAFSNDVYTANHRKLIADNDFFEFESILSELRGKIQLRKAAVAAFLYAQDELFMLMI